jgi:hypothetical protein
VGDCVHESHLPAKSSRSTVTLAATRRLTQVVFLRAGPTLPAPTLRGDTGSDDPSWAPPYPPGRHSRTGIRKAGLAAKQHVNRATVGGARGTRTHNPRIKSLHYQCNSIVPYSACPLLCQIISTAVRDVPRRAAACHALSLPRSSRLRGGGSTGSLPPVTVDGRGLWYSLHHGPPCSGCSISGRTCRPETLLPPGAPMGSSRIFWANQYVFPI